MGWRFSEVGKYMAVIVVICTFLGLYAGSRFMVGDTIIEMNMSFRENLYAERRDIVKRGCDKINRDMHNDYNSGHLQVESKHNIVYCPIPKVGSTFWRKVLSTMHVGGDRQQMSKFTYGSFNLTPLNKISKEEKNRIQNNEMSILFIRDPYARLFSGYENKIYHCNNMYWKSFGHAVVKYTRDSSDPVYERYGFNVTFPEFVSYVLYLHENNRSIEQHFAPMHKRCDPCSHHFQYIGKLETFKDDVDFLFNKWQKEYDDFHIEFKDFVGDSAVKTATGHNNFLFSAKHIISKIKFPFRKLMLRTWRDLQIRGYLSKHIPFPYDEDDDVDDVTREEFLEELKQGLAATTDREAAKAQRQEALIQAYRSVPMEDMERLRLYVMKDCLLFGFDDRPDYLFDRSLPVDDSFIYLDGL